MSIQADSPRNIPPASPRNRTRTTDGLVLPRRGIAAVVIAKEDNSTSHFRRKRTTRLHGLAIGNGLLDVGICLIGVAVVHTDTAAAGDNGAGSESAERAGLGRDGNGVAYGIGGGRVCSDKVVDFGAVGGSVDGVNAVGHGGGEAE